ncbi:hypothetical protein CCACVL1_30338 [Corchorus capsularis]|uniref:Uncharacterized protein n=1 Tax=Corchorus capsularis TaxID=210143 RepID=A0A1R3FXP4_COCAP|nr:hypothetical protein CCACVL1_30338 [Corchorus capsularis]
MKKASEMLRTHLLIEPSISKRMGCDAAKTKIQIEEDGV